MERELSLLDMQAFFFRILYLAQRGYSFTEAIQCAESQRVFRHGLRGVFQ